MQCMCEDPIASSYQVHPYSLQSYQGFLPLKAKQETKISINRPCYGDITNLMMGNTLPAKYLNPGSLVVKAQINSVSLPNTLIDLGDAINVMTKHTMEILGLTNLNKSTIVLQLVDQSSIIL